MSPELTIPIKPGGMYSDIVETDLGPNQHQEVVNWRLDKDGQCRTVRGYLNSRTGFTDIRAAIEITDDTSGDRCVLLQNGYGPTCLKRIDYDAGDADGYKNEPYTPLTLPDGVTIGNVTLRFHVFRGVVRITGGSKPLWYAYRSKTLFTDLYRVLDGDNFATGMDGWYGYNATLSRDNTVGYQYYGDYSMKVVQTGESGSARKTYYTTVGRTYRIRAFYRRNSDGQVGHVRLRVGTSPGSDDLGTVTQNDRDDWYGPLEVEFTATTTTTYFELLPAAYFSSLTAWFDFIIIEEKQPVSIDNWFLMKSEVDTYFSFNHVNENYVRTKGYSEPLVYRSWYYALFFIFDNGQYTLPHILNTEDLYQEINHMHGFARRFVVTFDHDTYQALSPRLTGVGLLVAEGTPFLDKHDPSTTWYVADVIDTYKDQEPEKKSFFLDSFFAAKETITPSHASDIGLKKHYRVIQGDYTPADADDEQEAAAHYEAILNAYKGRRCRLYGTKDSIETYFSYVEDGSWLGVTGGTLCLEMYFADDVTPAFYAGGKYDLSIDIYKEPCLVANGSAREIHFPLTVDLLNLPSITFDGFTGIPLGTKNTNPDYSHHSVVDGVAYANSEEDEEEDRGRYSPPFQFDVFPDGHLMRTEIGDADKIKVLLNRDNRIVALKKNSLSQMQWSGSRFYSDIGIANSGLYPINGWIVVDHILYYMDEEEVFAFVGMKPQPLLQSQKMRKYYTEHVDESSFFLWNKKDRELWLVLDTVIMVYQVDKNSWYVRDTDIDPVCGFNTFDGTLYAAAASKLVYYNHNSTPFDESIQASITSRLEPAGRMKTWKKAKSIDLFVQGNDDLTITVRDPALVDAEGQLPPVKVPVNINVVDYVTARLMYLFNSIEVEIKTEKAKDINMTLRLAELNVHAGGKR